MPGLPRFFACYHDGGFNLRTLYVVHRCSLIDSTEVTRGVCELLLMRSLLCSHRRVFARDFWVQNKRLSLNCVLHHKYSVVLTEHDYTRTNKLKCVLNCVVDP